MSYLGPWQSRYSLTTIWTREALLTFTYIINNYFIVLLRTPLHLFESFSYELLFY